MSTIDWEQRVRRLAKSCRHATGDEYPEAAENDPGHVPAHVLPKLAGLAKRLGYPVFLSDEGDVARTTCTNCGNPSCGGGVLGVTHSRVWSNGFVEPIDINVRAGMTDASTARVLGHELGHALKHRNRHGGGNYGGSQEEAACELGTAAFCEAAGIGTGRFLHRYLGQHVPGGRVSEQTIREAAANAQALWEAVQS